ncbi:unnamed protein product [Pedinophyceae sp. YPF-701]|nr:unnamed protein product [Pedinophyceae sp. YPF-701]
MSCGARRSMTRAAELAPALLRRCTGAIDTAASAGHAAGHDVLSAAAPSVARISTLQRRPDNAHSAIMQDGVPSARLGLRRKSTGGGPGDLRASLLHCVDIVRNNDLENWLWVGSLPKDMQPQVVTLRALATEIARIVDTVTEPGLASLRFQWWRERIAAALDPPGAESNTPGGAHPVLTALAAVHAKHPLTQMWLQRIVRTREAEAADPRPPADMDTLQAFAQGAHASLLTLQLEACGEASHEAEHAASHIGTAVGMSLLLRGTLAHAKARRCYLPSDVCANLGLSTEDIYRGRANPELLASAAFEVSKVAHAHLNEGLGIARALPKRARLLLLPAVPARLALAKLEKVNFDVTSPELQRGMGGINPLSLQAKLTWARLTGSL